MELQTSTSQEQLAGVTAALSSQGEVPQPPAAAIDPLALAAASADLASVVAAIQQLDSKLEAMKQQQDLQQQQQQVPSPSVPASAMGAEEGAVLEEQRLQRQSLSQLQASLDGMQASLRNIALQVAEGRPAAASTSFHAAAAASPPPRPVSIPDEEAAAAAPLHRDSAPSLASVAAPEAVVTAPSPSHLSEVAPLAMAGSDGEVMPLPLAQQAEGVTAAADAPQYYREQAEPAPQQQQQQRQQEGAPPTPYQEKAGPGPQQQQQGGPITPFQEQAQPGFQQQPQDFQQQAEGPPSPYLPRDMTGRSLSDTVAEALRLLRLGREEARRGEVRGREGLRLARGWEVREQWGMLFVKCGPEAPVKVTCLPLSLPSHRTWDWRTRPSAAPSRCSRGRCSPPLRTRRCWAT